MLAEGHWLQSMCGDKKILVGHGFNRAIKRLKGEGLEPLTLRSTSCHKGSETCVAKAYESHFGKGNGCGGEDAPAAAFLDEYHGAQVVAIPFAGRVYGEG